MFAGIVYPEEEGSLQKTDEVTTSMTIVSGDVPTWERNEISTRWPDKAKLSTQIVEDSTLKNNVNQTDASPFTAVVKMSESREENTSVNAWSTSYILTKLSNSAECFDDTCYKKYGNTSTVNTVDIETTTNLSAGLKDSKTQRQTNESQLSKENNTTEHPASQNQTTQSPHEPDLTMQPYTPKPVAGMNNLLPLPEKNEATLDMGATTHSYTPETPSVTSPRPVTPITTTTTTNSPSFWVWLFG